MKNEMQEQLSKLIADLDTRHRRVSRSDLVDLTTQKPHEVLADLRHMTNKRNKGTYELVCCYYPELELGDASAYDEFDKLVISLVGDCVWVGPPTDNDAQGSVSLLFEN